MQRKLLSIWFIINCIGALAIQGNTMAASQGNTMAASQGNTMAASQGNTMAASQESTIAASQASVQLPSVSQPIKTSSSDIIRLTLRKNINKIECARRLQEAGVIREPWLFLFHAFFMPALTPGVYTFAPRLSIKKICAILSQPKSYKVRIPEGLTVYEISRYLSKQSFLTGGLTQIPKEGSLLPATYDVHFGESREAVLHKMQNAMQKEVNHLWAEAVAEGHPLPVKSVEELITLASIIEKETGTKEERAHIAGVFFNRLKTGMPLQSDPTVTYAITAGKRPLGRSLTRADTKTISPINTYVTKGIPPQPIACPGKAALKAVLYPMETTCYYFVADGNGGHRFGDTLQMHNQNVKKWKESVKKQTQ